MVEGARLESVCTVILYREFESLTLRHFFIKKQAVFIGLYEYWLVFVVYWTAAFWSCARQSHEPRQVRQEAAISESLSVPQGCLDAVVQCTMS